MLHLLPLDNESTNQALFFSGLRKEISLRSSEEITMNFGYIKSRLLKCTNLCIIKLQHDSELPFEWMCYIHKLGSGKEQIMYATSFV